MEPGTVVQGCRVWSGWGVEGSSPSQVPSGRRSSVPGPGEQGLGKPWRSPPSTCPLMLSFPPCSVLSHGALWEKTLHQQQQDNKGHVSERTGGGRGKGDFGSNTPSSRASALPSSPSSWNQMGQEVRAGGRHGDHPTPRGTTSLPVGAQMMSLGGVFLRLLCFQIITPPSPEHSTSLDGQPFHTVPFTAFSLLTSYGQPIAVLNDLGTC